MTRRFIDSVVIALALVALVGFGAAAGETAGAGIYLEGRLPDGSPLRAALLSGEIEGRRAACSACHRPSGHGMSEGELDVPRVTGHSLFAPLDQRRVDLLPALYETPLSRTALATARTPRRRPAYNRASLARAITEGVDPTGRVLHPGMPRYRLDDQSTEALIDFLEGLGVGNAPGVDGQDIHFATVIAGDVSNARRAAIEAMIDGFVRQHNFDQQVLDANLGRFPYRKDLYANARRQWHVHIWQLEGPSEQWRAELAARYAKQPVFALIGGTATGSWAPIHQFCETTKIPCLFPDTALPEMTGSWTAYFSQGLFAEAETLAGWLSERPALLGQGPITQIVSKGAEPEALALTFANAMGHRLDLEVKSLGPDLTLETCPVLLLFWVSENDTGTVDRLMQHCGGETKAIISGGLLGANEARHFNEARPNVGMTYPFAVTERNNPDSVRHRAWMRSRRIASHDPLGEAKTYFALDAARHALRHMVDRFARSYFMENVEQVVEELPNPGLFDRLSLGAGQRFAAKGIYLFPPDEPDAGPEWIVSTGR
jgi:hypothetical protein